MILVTVGTHEQPFDRLIKSIDKIAKKKHYKFLLQIGYSNYKPQHIKNIYKFISYEKIIKIIKKSKIIVSHCGIGTVLLCLRYKKPIIIVPRLKEFNEHTDNHQLQLAEILERDKKAICVYDIEKLEESIELAKNLKIKPYKRGLIVKKIKYFIKKLSD